MKLLQRIGKIEAALPFDAKRWLETSDHDMSKLTDEQFDLVCILVDGEEDTLQAKEFFRTMTDEEFQHFESLSVEEQLAILKRHKEDRDK